MSVKSIRRFDKYLELFNNPPGDDRITLFFGELEDNAKQELSSRGGTATGGGYVDTDIVLKFTNKGLHCGNFIVQPPAPACINDTDIHPEWKDYIITFFMRLNCGTFQNDPKKLALLKQLRNVAGSIDQFILVILNKIAIFKITGDTSNKSFINNFTQLQNITGYIFKDEIDIFGLIEELAPAASTIFTNIGDVLDHIETTHGLTARVPRPDGTAANVTTSARGLMGAGSKKADWDACFNNSIWTVAATGETLTTMARAQLHSNDVDEVMYAYFKAIRLFVLNYDTRKEFGYNFDKYFKNKIFSAQEASIPVKVSNFFSDPINIQDTQYWRKADSTLWTLEAGKEVQVDMKSEKYNKLSHKEKCFSTNFLSHTGALKSTNPVKTCSDYLRECLSGNDIDKCKDFLKEPEYWSIAEAEVKEMLPAIALKTLESFEFKKYSTYDATNKMDIIKVINPTKWLEHLQKMTQANPSKLTTAEYTAIAQNTNLMGYLNLLVKKINENPTLLNPSIKKSDEQKRYNKDAFKGTVLATMGMSARIPASTLSVSSVKKLGTAIEDSQNRTRALIRLNPLSLMLSGGSAQVDELENKLSSETEQTWPVFAKHYKVILDKFKTIGKDITKDDKEEIEKLIEKLKDSEVKLMKIYLMSEKYKDLLDIHGQKDSRTVLTVDNLKNFVDQRNRYFTRVSRRQNTLVDVMTALAEALQKENPVKTEPENDPKEEALKMADLIA